MTTELINLPCGTVEIVVTRDQFTARGWVTTPPVPTKEAQLKKSIEEAGQSIHRMTLLDRVAGGNILGP